MRFVPALALSALLLAACGGSDPGSGTQTLYVEAEAHQNGEGNHASIAVSVLEGSSSGDVISNAVVTVRDADGNEYGLPWEGVQIGGWKAGAYQIKDIDWSPGWRLEVRRGDDGLEAALDAPGTTRITAPAPGSTVHKSDAAGLEVVWEDGSGKGADHVRVDLKKADYDRTLDQDDHHLIIDPGALVVEDKEEVRVRRWAEINLAGGTAGSYFRAMTEDSVELHVAQ